MEEKSDIVQVRATVTHDNAFILNCVIGWLYYFVRVYIIIPHIF